MYQVPCGPEIALRCKIDKVPNKHRHLEDNILLSEGSPGQAVGMDKAKPQQRPMRRNPTQACLFAVLCTPEGASRIHKPLFNLRGGFKVMHTYLRVLLTRLQIAPNE